jgi:Fanconi anemia group J protein
VSEGIDFADGRARCVMVVGIPYPHAKDSKVALKKDYNNATAAASARAGAGAAAWPGAGGSSGSRAGPPRLLTGDAWYSQQAFRALNQVGAAIVSYPLHPHFVGRQAGRHLQRAYNL